MRDGIAPKSIVAALIGIAIMYDWARVAFRGRLTSCFTFPFSRYRQLLKYNGQFKQYNGNFEEDIGNFEEDIGHSTNFVNPKTAKKARPLQDMYGRRVSLEGISKTQEPSLCFSSSTLLVPGYVL